MILRVPILLLSVVTIAAPTAYVNGDPRITPEQFISARTSEEFAPPAVVADISAAGPPSQPGSSVGSGGSGRIRTSLSPTYWKLLPYLGENAAASANTVAGLACVAKPNGDAGLQVPAASMQQLEETGLPIGEIQILQLTERSTGESLGTTRYLCVADSAIAPRGSVPSIWTFLQAIASDELLHAATPSFSPSRRALAGMEFRAWGTDSGPSSGSVTASVNGWSVQANVQRLGYRFTITEPSSGRVLFETVTTNLGDEQHPAFRYTFQKSIPTVSVQLSTVWNVSQSLIRGSDLGSPVNASVTPLGEVSLDRTASFEVIQLRSALRTQE